MDNEIFAIDNELSTELMTRQNELNKAIYHHRALLNDKNGDNIIKAKIIEKKILQICEQQKHKFNGLRRERLKVSDLDPIIYKQQQIKTNYQTLPKQYILSNQTLLKPKNAYLNQQSDKQQSQLKSFNGQKFIIPNERMLVVSTPGGGARLVTTSTNTTRSTLSKSNNNGYTSNSLLNNNKTQFNNFTITNTSKPIITNLSNNDKSINLNQLQTTESSTTNTNNTNINKRKSVIQPLIDRQEEQLIINKPKEVFVQQPQLNEQEKIKQDDNKVKEEYFFALGLLTKKALSEIQNKKSERKRRTTANPQFSSAAIAAKRNLALELAAKKAKKRELAASNNQDKYLNQQTTKRNFLNSNNNRNKVNKQDNKKQVSKVTNKQLNSQTQNKQSNQDLSINCFSCGDLCDSDLDVIGFCAHCKLLFHVYCTTSVEKLRETNGYVPCPKCDRKKLLEPNNDLNDTISASDLIQKPKLESNSSTSSSIISKTTRRRKLSTQSKNGTLNSNNNNNNNNNNRINNVTQLKTNTGKLKSTSDKNNDKVKLLIRHYEVIKLKSNYLDKLSKIRGELIVSNDHKNNLLLEQQKTLKAIQTIVNLCSKIREQKDNNNQKENKEIGKANKIELVNKLDNNLKQEDKIEDNSVNNNLLIDNNINELNNNQLIEKNEEIDLSKLNKDDNDKNNNETNETVNILNSLSTTDQQSSIEKLPIKQQSTDQNSLIKKEVELELTEKEKDLMQDYTEVEKEVIQNLINYSNSTIQHQDSQLINDNQLSNQDYQIESSNQINSQLTDNIIKIADQTDNQNKTVNRIVEQDVDLSTNDDQPPKKKICTPERKTQDLIENDVIMDEINMAIASISS